MSLDETKIQGFAPIDVKQKQLKNFFDALRKRTVTKPHDNAPIKLTDIPFQGTSQTQKDIGLSNSNTQKRKKRARSRDDSDSDSGSSTSKPKKRKQRVKFDDRLKSTVL